MANQRLANDARRAWVCLAVTVAVTTVVAVGGGVLLGGGVLDDMLVFQTVNLLLVYVVYFALYAAVTIWTFRGQHGDELRRVLRESTPRNRGERLSRTLSGGGATSWAASAALTALAVAVLIAFAPALREQPVVLALTGLMVVGAWLQVPTAYAVQYLRDDVDDQGLEFPGGSDFRFGDYFYVAVQVSTTFSSSDVAVTRADLRRRVTTHSLISFLFNSVIIALVVSALLIAAPTQ